MKEHLDLQRLHNILQKMSGMNAVDPERHFKVHQFRKIKPFIMASLSTTSASPLNT